MWTLMRQPGSQALAQQTADPFPMPHQNIWVEPDLFIKHNGVQVYHDYEEDDFDQPAEFDFRIYPSGYPVGDDWECFDVRRLSTWVAGDSHSDPIEDAIKRAIESGELDNDGRHPVKKANP